VSERDVLPAPAAENQGLIARGMTRAEELGTLEPKGRATFADINPKKAVRLSRCWVKERIAKSRELYVTYLLDRDCHLLEQSSVSPVTRLCDRCARSR